VTAVVCHSGRSIAVVLLSVVGRLDVVGLGCGGIVVEVLSGEAGVDALRGQAVQFFIIDNRTAAGKYIEFDKNSPLKEEKLWKTEAELLK
jgi:hypothetical protein